MRLGLHYFINIYCRTSYHNSRRVDTNKHINQTIYAGFNSAQPTEPTTNFNSGSVFRPYRSRPIFSSWDRKKVGRRPKLLNRQNTHRKFINLCGLMKFLSTSRKIRKLENNIWQVEPAFFRWQDNIAGLSTIRYMLISMKESWLQIVGWPRGRQSLIFSWYCCVAEVMSLVTFFQKLGTIIKVIHIAGL